MKTLVCVYMDVLGKTALLVNKTFSLRNNSFQYFTNKNFKKNLYPSKNKIMIKNKIPILSFGSDNKSFYLMQYSFFRRSKTIFTSFPKKQFSYIVFPTVT